MFTERYAMSPYIKQICIFFKEQFTVKGFKNTSCRENTQRAAGDAIYQWNYNGRSRKYIYQEVTSSDKVTDLYSEGNPFESRSGHQLSSQFSWIYSDTLVKFFYRNLLHAGGFSHTLSHSIILPSVIIIRRYVTWHTQESLRQLGLQILKKIQIHLSDIFEDNRESRSPPVTTFWCAIIFLNTTLKQQSAQVG